MTKGYEWQQKEWHEQRGGGDQKKKMTQAQGPLGRKGETLEIHQQKNSQ